MLAGKWCSKADVHVGGKAGSDLFRLVVMMADLLMAFALTLPERRGYVVIELGGKGETPSRPTDFQSWLVSAAPSRRASLWLARFSRRARAQAGSGASPA